VQRLEKRLAGGQPPIRWNGERPMSDLERRIADAMLAKLRERDPSLTAEDLSRPVGDLELDSLDLIELHQNLERELQVKGDQKKTVGFVFLDEFSTYFAELASHR
jgi:acyl carrier protein